MNEKRLFLAVPLPDAVRDLLSEVQEKLEPVFGARGRTPRQSMHITVKFLGGVKESEELELTAALQKLVREIAPFQLVLNRLTTFGNPRAPRIVAIALTPVDEIRSLAKQVDRLCEKVGFSREKRAFSPHVTIYRPKKKGEIQKDFSLSAATVPVRELVLFQSELKPSGAVYHTLETFPLSGRGRESGLNG